MGYIDIMSLISFVLNVNVGRVLYIGLSFSSKMMYISENKVECLLYCVHNFC